MATVRFYGDLRRFGDKFKLDVTTTAEAIRALCVQIPGLRARLRDGHFRVRVRKQDITNDTVPQAFAERLTQDVIHIVPVVSGAKDSGLFSVVVGAVMIGAAFFTGGASLAAWGALSTGLAAAGAGMVIAGSAMMLAPTPETSQGRTTDNGERNQYFNNLDNGVAQGSVVPLVYGEVMVGSKVLSQGLSTD